MENSKLIEASLGLGGCISPSPISSLTLLFWMDGWLAVLAVPAVA